MDVIDRGLVKLFYVLDYLNLKETLVQCIFCLKRYKAELQHKKERPRYLEMLFHWTLNTKITQRNILNLVDDPILVPVSDIYLFELSELLPVDQVFELGALMEVEENVLHTIEGEDILTDPSYKPFRILVKSRQKNDELVHYVMLLMDMVKAMELADANEFVNRETRKWMETVADKNKDICIKLENLLSQHL